jgi:Flp pilus assembly protein TadG
MSTASGRLVRCVKHFRKSEYGGALVELAVVTPVVLLLAIGVIDYGRVYFTSVAVANAARAGAEYGTAMPANQVDTVGIRTFAQLDGAEAGSISIVATTIYKCGGTVVSASATCAGYGVPRVYVEVTATKAVTMFLKHVGLPATVTVARTATFRAQ